MLTAQFWLACSVLGPHWRQAGFGMTSSAGKASLVAQRSKRLPAMRETWVWSLDREDLLEKEMAAHSSILAWRIPWTEEPGGLQSTGLQRAGHDWATSLVLEEMGWMIPSNLYKKILSVKPQGSASKLLSLVQEKDVCVCMRTLCFLVKKKKRGGMYSRKSKTSWWALEFDGPGL